MKTIFASLVIFVLVGSQLNAQSFGLKAGYTSSSFSEKQYGIKTDQNYKSKNGFNVGAIIDFELNKTLTINTGLHYVNKGFELNERIYYSSTTNDINASIDLSYVGIPVQLKIYQNLTDKIKVYGVAGGFLDFAVKAKSTFTETFVSGIIYPNTPKVETRENNIPISFKENEFSPLDFGTTLGFGIQFNSILLEANYNIGLNNTLRNYTGDQKGKNRHLNVSLGYIFNKPKKEKS